MTNKIFLKALVKYGKLSDINLVNIDKNMKGVNKDGILTNKKSQDAISSLYYRYFIFLKKKFKRLVNKHYELNSIDFRKYGLYMSDFLNMSAIQTIKHYDMSCGTKISTYFTTVLLNLIRKEAKKIQNNIKTVSLVYGFPVEHTFPEFIIEDVKNILKNDKAFEMIKSYYIDGLKYKQIGERVGFSGHWVKVSIQKHLKKIREKMSGMV